MPLIIDTNEIEKAGKEQNDICISGGVYAADSGFHAFFPDLESCEADGPDLEDAIENARDAAHNWIQVELDEFEGDLPFASHEEDIVLKEGQFIRKISVTIKLLPDSD